MNRLNSLPRALPPLVLSLMLFAIYLTTLAPGLTWANGGSDGGDLIAAAATGGVAHPTGYPLYLLLARAFQLLPVGSLAFRTNLFSAVSMTLAALFVYALVLRLAEGSNEMYPWPAGLVAGISFGLAPLVWSQAVITEVYGLQALLVALLLYLYSGTPGTAELPVTPRRLDRLRGLLLGLAMGNHLTSVLLVPAALVVGSVHHRAVSDGIAVPRRSVWSRLTLDRAALLRQLGMFAVGLSLYLLIPLRAAANPPINWGNAITLERFWWLVSAELYQSYYLQFDLPGALERLQSAAALLVAQFGVPGVILGCVGLILFGKGSRLFLLTLWTAVLSTFFYLLYIPSNSDVYLIPAFLSFAVWIGCGIAGLTNRLTRGSWALKLALPLLLIVTQLSQSIPRAGELDASMDLRAESFGRGALSAAPQDAIVFAHGDEAVFTLWYFHFALGERPDLAVVAVDLLHFDWYQESLRSTYPALAVPAPLPFPESLASANPSRATCNVRYAPYIEIACSPPLLLP